LRRSQASASPPGSPVPPCRLETISSTRQLNEQTHGKRSGASPAAACGNTHKRCLHD
jgi:hypothetical protein